MQLEATDAVEIKKIGGLCRQERRTTNTDCQNTPKQFRFSIVRDGWMPEDRNTERNKKNEGEHS